MGAESSTRSQPQPRQQIRDRRRDVLHERADVVGTGEVETKDGTHHGVTRLEPTSPAQEDDHDAEKQQDSNIDSHRGAPSDLVLTVETEAACGDRVGVTMTAVRGLSEYHELLPMLLISGSWPVGLTFQHPLTHALMRG